jgi:predicted ATPase
VGREDELRAVLSLIDEVSTSGRPRLITIVGAAGVGKSRLVRDVVLAAVERRPETRVLRGRCLAAGDGITYWALGEILREACGIALGETGRVAQQRLRDRLRPLLTARLNEPDVDATIHALAATAAIPLPDNPLDDAAPRDVAEELARAWPRFATAIAAGGSLILVVEDLHSGRLPPPWCCLLASATTGLQHLHGPVTCGEIPTLKCASIVQRRLPPAGRLACQSPRVGRAWAPLTTDGTCR